MKKNLRIVSAAAAALLAVAPVAATAVVSAPASTVQAAANETVSTSVNTTVSEDKLQQTAADAAGNYLKAHQPANNGMSVNGNSVNGDDVTISPLDLSKVTIKTSNQTVNKTNNTITSASVDAEYETPVTVTVKNVASKTAAQKADLTLGPSWGNTVYSTETTGAHKLNFVSFKDGVATYSFNLPKLVVNFPNATATVKAPSNSSSSSLQGSNNSSIFYGDVNTAVNINAVAATKVAPGAFNGNITATVDGKSLTAVIETTNKDGQNTVIYKKGQTTNPVKPSDLQAGVEYQAQISNVRFYLGADKQGKNVSFVLPDGSVFASNNSRTKSVTVGADGYADLGQINSDFYAYDATNVRGINFFSKKTGNVVTSGSVDLHAVNGKLNVESVYAKINEEYGALQAFDKQSVPTVLLPLNDIKDQLEKQNIKVDANGYFTAPASFNLTMTAKSRANGAEATLPVAVTVDNVTPAAAQENTKTVKIMHIATIYDKNGKATHEPALRAYHTVSVVSDPVTLKDEKGNDAGKFYKLAGKDQYIKVGNVDGTSRSLKHNSYVYKSTGKRRGKTVLKKGSSVTTYGKSFMIAGHQMYRIGENKYVKKANF